MSTINNKSRYPGIRAFEKNEKHVFFGRRLESKKLYNLVKAKPLVVLFAKSGIGKSSLINAGLEPLIEKDFYYVIKIRLQTTAISSVEMVKNELKPYLNKAKLKANTEGTPGLWEYLRACEFKKGKEDLTPVLVFDQFEEFFEHNKKDQEELNRELADMVSDRLPERIRESLRAIPFRDRTKEQLDWHSPIPVKFVFAIRSDRMSQMDEMSIKIPSILHNRFHLKPLGIEAAREAIVEPAGLPGDDFDTPRFTYSNPALNTMLDYLKNKNEEVESFQLQLLCRNIERTVQRKNEENVVVQESDFGGASGIKSILNNYYEQEIGELQESEQTIARKFIEEGLIVAGRRVGVSEGVEKKSFAVEKDLLLKLLASRLIRAENTHLGRSYELSHDTLVAPILQSYEIRRRQEEQLAAFQKQEAQEKLLVIERKKRNRAMLLAAAGFLLFIIAAAGGFYAAQQSRKARVAQKEAEELKTVAYEERDKARAANKKLEEIQIKMAELIVEKGEANINLNEYKAAEDDFDLVLALESKMDSTNIAKNKGLFEKAKTLKKRASNGRGVGSKFDELMTAGKSAENKARRLTQRNQKTDRVKAFQLAYQKFKAAKDLESTTLNDATARSEMSKISAELVKEFDRLLSEIKTYLDVNSCSQATKRITQAESIRRQLPSNQLSTTKVEKLKDYKSKCQ